MFISPQSLISELSFKSVMIGCVLAVVMSAVNVYLGLKAGSTISACIPASILGMSVLSFTKRSNILEGNIVQTIASIGGSIASSSIFLPALILNNTWESFDYMQTLCILLTGAMFGIFIIIPLRSAFIGEESLSFPEGVATAEILKSGYDKTNTNSIFPIIIGFIFGSVIKILQTGLQIIQESIPFCVKGCAFTIGMSPAMISTGIIVGPHALGGLFLGSIMCFFILNPAIALVKGLDNTSFDAVMDIWRIYTRNIGIGTMIVGGIYSVIQLISPIVDSIKTSLHAISKDRMEQDISLSYVSIGILFSMIPLFYILYNIIESYSLMFMIFFLLVIGIIFISCAMASQLIGVVGSSHAPISGIFLISTIFISIFALIFIGNNTVQTLSSIVLVVACIASISAAISGENMQDLKTGYVVGATPWKQQVSLMVGAIPVVLIVPLIYRVLVAAYGMAGINGASSQALAVPKAGMLANLARAIFENNLENNMLMIGIAIGISSIVLNALFNKSAWLFSPFSIAIGIYMPPEVTTAVAIGAFAKYYFISEDSNYLLMPAGTISGEAIIGVILAIPFAIFGSSIFALNIFSYPVQIILGIIATYIFLYRMTRKV